MGNQQVVPAGLELDRLTERLKDRYRKPVRKSSTHLGVTIDGEDIAFSAPGQEQYKSGICAFVRRKPPQEFAVQLKPKVLHSKARFNITSELAPNLVGAGEAWVVKIGTVAELDRFLEWFDQFGHIGEKVLPDREVQELGTEHPLNQILYGPPGTGKTFNLARIAVEICDGKAPEDRTELMTRYRELVSQKRIDFVTFHQSYSYEEFVQGLRPHAGDEGESNNSGGFSLKPEDGIFKRIADRAKTAGATLGKIDTPKLTNQRIFKMSLGQANDPADAYLFEECMENGYILLGYGGDVDWSQVKPKSFSDIKEYWREKFNPEVSGNDPNIVCINHLFLTMKVGDFVVVSKGNMAFRAIGVVAGDYEYVAREEDGFHHRRKVDWIWVHDEGLPVEEIYDTRFTQYTLVEMKREKLNQAAFERLVTPHRVLEQENKDNFVLIMDEINRANISKVFGELITLIEDDKRLGTLNALTANLPYSKIPFGVPKNLYLLGTMNTADRSIALLDTALRRRFNFREFMPNPALLSNNIDGVDLQGVLTTLNARLEYMLGRDYQIGHAYFMDCKTLDEVSDVMRGKVLPLLQEYFYDDWSKIFAVLGEEGDGGTFMRRSKLKSPFGNEDAAQDRYEMIVDGSVPPEKFQKLFDLISNEMSPEVQDVVVSAAE
ncbi:AAA family ATPase [Kordiimonas marina]|uniref:AAA family ATPase n=1 Tax=Kordiimonas marina TaxID=2872312 RepID=UPI001FF31DDE|nr:AAA family ATPase [Kordiimonas marina]MCJ9428061.1 AAA family ATPase [Kordiimonas marina]